MCGPCANPARMDGNTAPLETVQMASSRETHHAAGDLTWSGSNSWPIGAVLCSVSTQNPQISEQMGDHTGTFCSPHLQAGFGPTKCPAQSTEAFDESTNVYYPGEDNLVLSTETCSVHSRSTSPISRIYAMEKHK